MVPPPSARIFTFIYFPGHCSYSDTSPTFLISTPRPLPQLGKMGDSVTLRRFILLCASSCALAVVVPIIPHPGHGGGVGEQTVTIPISVSISVSPGIAVHTCAPDGPSRKPDRRSEMPLPLQEQANATAASEHDHHRTPTNQFFNVRGVNTQEVSSILVNQKLKLTRRERCLGKPLLSNCLKLILRL